jgi:hypothetical protein
VDIVYGLVATHHVENVGIAMKSAFAKRYAVLLRCAVMADVAMIVAMVLAVVADKAAVTAPVTIQPLKNVVQMH